MKGEIGYGSVQSQEILISCHLRELDEGKMLVGQGCGQMGVLTPNAGLVTMPLFE